MQLTDSIRGNYLTMLAGCSSLPEKRTEVLRTVTQIFNERAIYERISAALFPHTVPWWVIASLHHMECDLDFNLQLHNGDSLKHHTVNAPAGRPPGTPPFTFMQSATDALGLNAHWRSTDDACGWLFYMEAFNGFGYRIYHPETPSPYLWGGSNQAKPGKYVADGQWDSHATTDQIGVATLLKAMMYERLITVAIR